MFQTRNLRPLLELFNFERKRDVVRHCKTLVVYSGDLASLFLAAQTGGLAPYRYACRFLNRVPDQLSPTVEEFEAAGRAKVGKLTGKAGKFFRKIDQTFKDRRLFAAHLFYSSDKLYWHLFYFDQRDYAEQKNHWQHGTHIHYVNDMFHRDSIDDIWARVITGETTFLRGLHLQYVESHRVSVSNRHFERDA